MVTEDTIEKKLKELGFHEVGFLDDDKIRYDHDTKSGLSVFIDLENQEATLASRKYQYSMMISEFLEVKSVEVREYFEIVNAVRAIAMPNIKQARVWILLDWELVLQHG